MKKPKPTKVWGAVRAAETSLAWSTTYFAPQTARWLRVNGYEQQRDGITIRRATLTLDPVPTRRPK